MISVGGTPRPLILVVEDDDDARQAYALILEPEGYRVELAADGKQALSMIDARAPDLILVDFSLRSRGGSRPIRGLGTFRS